MRKEIWTSIILAGSLLAGVTACERAGEPSKPATSSPPSRQQQPSSPPSSPGSQPEKQQPGGTQQ
jgi:hypothetical protein